MKIRQDQLEAHLKKTLAPCYFVFGEEPLFVQEACALIRMAAKAQGYLERQVFHADGQFQWQDLQQCADSLSLFSEKTFIDMHMQSGKPGDKGSKALQAYCENPPPDKVLMLRSGKLESAGQKAVWFQALNEHGVIVQVWPPRPRELPGWIQQRAEQKKLHLTPPAVQIIAERVEGNLLAAAQEVEKLYLLYGHGEIDDSMVLHAVADSAKFSIYQLADDALTGNLGRCARNLQGLRQEGVEPVLVLWAIVRDLRVLAELNQPDRKGPIDTRLTQLGVWQIRQPLFKKAATRLSFAEFASLLQQAARIDGMIKGMHKGPVWESMLRLLAGLCGVELFDPAATGDQALTLIPFD